MKRKKSKNIYDEVITIDNILKMWNIVKKTCNNRKQIFLFSLNLNSNIMTLYNRLKDRTYVPGKYKTFLIFEPKPRLIMNQSVSDKIVNHLVANYFLIPYLENTLIDSNIATRRGKGSSYGIDLLKKYFNKLLINKQEIYCLKIDVSKYFYNIDHKLLLEMLEKKIKDDEVISLIKLIVSQTNKEYINKDIEMFNSKYNVDIPLYKSDTGLSIGAMTSQFLAIYFLNDLDHYIKEELKCKYYIRYMDDFIILDYDKNKLLDIYDKIKKKLEDKKLQINRKSNIYKCSNSFKFLGYKFQIVNNRLIISSNNKTFYKIRKKLKLLYSFDYIKFMRSSGSYCGYFKVINNNVSGDFKLKTKDLYEAYKEKNPSTLVIVKEGIFYKTFNQDAKIIWFLFGYKYIDGVVSFGTSPYNKVVLKLKDLDINFIIVNKTQELVSYIKSTNNYDAYLSVSNTSFNKAKKTLDIHNLMDKLINNNEDNYHKIYNFLSSLLIEENT